MNKSPAAHSVIIKDRIRIFIVRQIYQCIFVLDTQNEDIAAACKSGLEIRLFVFGFSGLSHTVIPYGYQNTFISNIIVFTYFIGTVKLTDIFRIC